MDPENNIPVNLSGIASIRAINMPAYPSPNWFMGHWYNFKRWIEYNNPFSGYLYVNSPEEYKMLHHADKTVFEFWYLNVIVKGDGTARQVIGTKKDRDTVESMIKAKFPIQYKLRKIGFFIKCRLGDCWDNFCYFMNPRQKWLKKQIPNSWSDKTELIRSLNFAMVVNFIEGEKALDVTDWKASSEYHDEFSVGLKDCYDYIKIYRPRLEKEHENSYPADDTVGDYCTIYAETNRLEKLIEDMDTKYLTWIVQNRAFFWT